MAGRQQTALQRWTAEIPAWALVTLLFASAGIGAGMAAPNRDALRCWRYGDDLGSSVGRHACNWAHTTGQSLSVGMVGLVMFLLAAAGFIAIVALGVVQMWREAGRQAAARSTPFNNPR